MKIIDINLKLSICAYFLSKFDIEAVKYLGYQSRNEAMIEMSKILGKENTYLKRRRDEFDVLTGSPRKGQRNRNPSPAVTKIHQDLREFTFLKLATIVQLILSISETLPISPISDVDKKEILESVSETDIENFINQKDISARFIKRYRELLERLYNHGIPDKLKELYAFRCQICGLGAEDTFGYKIVEAHHINPFSVSLNNDSSNIIILCPNHHRLMHKANPSFNRQTKAFVYANGIQENLKYNLHI